MTASHPTPHLLINGLPLLGSSVGIANSTRRLIEGLVRQAPTIRLRLLLPASAGAKWAEHFPSLVDSVSGKSPPSHPLLAEIWWNNRIVRWATSVYAGIPFLATADMWAARRPRVVLQTAHDCLLERFPELAGRRWIRRLYRRACLRWARRADLVLTPSRFSADDLGRFASIPRSKIAVVPWWLDIRYASSPSPGAVAQVRRAYQLPPDFWLYVGGYLKHKNVNALVRAYAQVRMERELPPLVLAGSIRRNAEALGLIDPLTTAEELGIASSIRAIGHVAEDDLPALYAGASLFVFPSLHEGFGYSPAEALAAGTPLLVSNRGSLPEVIPAPHCQFDPENIDELAAALRRAATDSRQFAVPPNPEFGEAQGVARLLAALEPFVPEIRGSSAKPLRQNAA
jgi:glycosyltransferase involved in cell wall biosynthesis